MMVTIKGGCHESKVLHPQGCLPHLFILCSPRRLLMAPAPTQEQVMHGITRLIALDSARFVLRSQIQARVCAKNGWTTRDVTARIITLALARLVRANEVAIGNGDVFQGSMLVFRHC